MFKINSLIAFLKNSIFLDKNEKNYIKYNLLRWKQIKKNDYKSVILVDLFPFNPYIQFYSYMANIFSLKLKATPKYFYFDLYQGRQSKSRLFITKLKKIYQSFNVVKGISEYDFKFTNDDNEKYENAFKKLKFRNDNLVKYKYKNFLIGDLIYDTYQRIHYSPTVDMQDKALKKIFYRAHKIFDEVENYFNNNDVKCVIPSHVCYINYGIISKIASKNKIPIIKIWAKNRGNSLYRLLKINEKVVNEEPPYYNYKKTFLKFNNVEKKRALSIGKKIIKKRVSGFYDENLPYMPKSSFNRELKKIDIGEKLKKKIILFPHCYFDNPHRYRHMIFEDFYRQMKFFLDYSKNNDDYEWYYKPHPNELKSELGVHKKLLKDYPNVKYLDKNTSHKSIISLKPACVITNHGTLAHEYAFYKIPVINTGDNPHINYNFSLHLKSKREILRVLKNLRHYTKKINFDKKYIYEYMFLHFEYFPNLHNEKKYLKDDFFAFRKIQKNITSEILKKYTNQSKHTDIKIKKYIQEFADKNL